MLGADKEKLLVQMAVDQGQLKRQLDQAQSSISGFAGSIKNQLGGLLAGLTVGAGAAYFASITKGALEAADSMGDLAASVGVPVETLSKFKLAADVSGASLETLGKGFKELGITMVESLRNPVSDTAKAFETLGVEVKDTTTNVLRPTEDVMLDLADAFAGMEDGAQKTALAADLFGKKIGPQLVPYLNNGKEGLKELAATAEALGLTLDQKTVAAADRTNDMFTILGQVSSGLGNKILKEVLPTLEGLSSQFLETAKNSGALDTAAKSVAAAFKLIVSVGIGAFNALQAVGGALGGVAAAMVQALSGDFRGAWNTIRSVAEDTGKRVITTGQQIGAVWDESLGTLDDKAIALAKSMQVVDRASAGAKNAVAEYAKAAQLVADLTAKNLGVSGDYVAKLRLLELWYSRNADKTDEYREAVIALINAQESSQKLAKEQADAEREIAKALADAADERAKSIAAYGNETAKINEQVRALELEAAQLDLTTEAKAALTIEMRNAEIARLQALATTDLVLLAGQDEIDSINARIEALQRLNDAERNFATKSGIADAAKRTRDEWTRTAGQIEQALTDAMVSGFSGGRSIAKSIGDWIANYFKTTVARTIAQALTGALSLSLPGFASAGAGAGGGTATGGAAGGIGNLGNLLSLGGAMSGAFGAGVFGSLGTLGLTGGVGIGGTLTAAGSLIGTGSAAGIGAGLSMGAGALVPYLGIAVGIYALADKIRKNGGSPALQNYSVLNATPAQFDYDKFPSVVSSSAFDEDLRNIVAVVSSTAAALGGAARQTGYGLGTSVSPDGKGGTIYAQVDSPTGRSLLDFSENGPNATVADRLAAQIPRLILAGLQDSDLPQQFADFFSSIDIASVTQEQIQQAIQTAQTASEVARLIGDVGNASVEALVNIADLSGGISQLSSNIGTYYQEFYSQTERETMLRADLTEALGRVNVALPKSREAFRALVESQDLTTESGRQTYTTLLSVAGAFAQLNPEVEAMAETMSSAADIAAERADLERRLLEVMGDTAALRRLEIEALDPSNRALLERIFALEDEARAAEASAAAAERVSTERAGLESRLLRALGDTTALREMELAALDESNRELLRRIYALEDEAAAAREAAAALEQARMEVERVSAERYGLETRLLQAQGETAKVRQRELAALDASNRSLLQQIHLIEDWKRATQQAAQAAADVAREQIAALRPLVSFIEDAIAEIMGGGGLGMTAEQGRQFVSQAARTATTTGYLPEREQLQQAVQAAQGGFGMFATRADEQRARIQLAKQLEAIGGVADDQLSDAEVALAVANDQLKQLQEINAGIRKLSEFGGGAPGKPGGDIVIGPGGDLAPITIGPVENVELDAEPIGDALAEAVGGEEGQKRIPWDPFRPLAHLMGEPGEGIPWNPFNPLAHLMGRKQPEQTDMEKLIERVEILSSDTRKIRRQLARTRALTDKGEAIRVTTQPELT